ncbi:hypothetical protein AB0G32_07015 [Streptomyces sp. NPDC023723]|uniref:hypothetical protein n=1 Tax=Streptomyces sp. NPDC023723 TaxID=3154323 RepID=UPI0033E7CA99
MRHRIARLTAPPLLLLLELFLPATGRRRRRRRAAGVPRPARVAAPTPPARLLGVPLLRGEDNALVRPYLEATR